MSVAVVYRKSLQLSIFQKQSEIMAHTIVTILLLVKLSQSNFGCKTLISSPTGNHDDDETSISCTDPTYPTLVSCGFSKFNDPTSNTVDGGYMTSDGTACVAQNGNTGGSSLAYARY